MRESLSGDPIMRNSRGGMTINNTVLKPIGVSSGIQSLQSPSLVTSTGKIIGSATSPPSGGGTNLLATN